MFPLSISFSVSHFLSHMVFNFYGFLFAITGYLLEKEMAKITRAVGSMFPRLFIFPQFALTIVAVSQVT